MKVHTPVWFGSDEERWNEQHDQELQRDFEKFDRHRLQGLITLAIGTVIFCGACAYGMIHAH